MCAAKAVGVYCDHFHGKNYATIDAPGVIFRLSEGRVVILDRLIEAASERTHKPHGSSRLKFRSAAIGDAYDEAVALRAIA